MFQKEKYMLVLKHLDIGWTNERVGHEQDEVIKLLGDRDVAALLTLRSSFLEHLADIGIAGSVQLGIFGAVEPRTGRINRFERWKRWQCIQHTNALGIAQNRFDVTEMDLERVDRQWTRWRREFVQIVADDGVVDIGNFVFAEMRHQVGAEPRCIELLLLFG